MCSIVQILFFVLWILEALFIYKKNMLLAVLLLVFTVVLTAGAVCAEDTGNGTVLALNDSITSGNGSTSGNSSDAAAGSTNGADVKTSAPPIKDVKGYWIRYETRYLNSVSLATLKSQGVTDLFVLTPKDNLNAIKPFIDKFGGTGGLRIHAWIICFKGSNGWINPDPNTTAGKNVQDLIRADVSTLINNYNIQGIHLDYVRYPGTAYKIR